MKQIIKKSIVFITAVAIMLITLAMPMSAEAASKKAPKLNKTKTTLTITKKKTKPAVQLKVKNAAGRKVKWTSSNRKAVTKKPITNPEPTPNGECEHDWVERKEVVGMKYACVCGTLFDTEEQWTIHNDEVVENGGTRHSYGPYNIYETYYECSKCGKTK